ncbi:MAG: hypothetical protein JSR40_09020 [Proteobacteria bacterium]|nr:hypothetical protein [Pseudomonadota bacterium]
MITRQTVAAVLSTTAIAFSICAPARAASLAEAYAARSVAQADNRNDRPADTPANTTENRPRASR